MKSIDWEVDTIVKDLRVRREEWRRARQRFSDTIGREFPSVEVLAEITKNLAAVLFPMRLGPDDLQTSTEDYFIGYTLDKTLHQLLDQIQLELKSTKSDMQTPQSIRDQGVQIVKRFSKQLAAIRSQLDTDVEAAYKGDPAARSMDEVLLCYPGMRAIINHRIAHVLFHLNLPLIARIIAEISHSQTGIDIHPGAVIGDSFFIDHGTGVVIGETARIGARVRIYQAVTLGAKRFELDDEGALAKGVDRHPIIEDDVVIYAGATLLGRITIGQGSSIGGNVWLTHSVPAFSQITQVSSEQR